MQLRQGRGPAAQQEGPGPVVAAKTALSDREAVIRNAGMSEEMQQDAVECATQALEKYSIEKDIAAHTKKQQEVQSHLALHCEKELWQLRDS
ncbi:Dyl1 [Columba livia]|nr:Dyl1 [Columba livia]